MSAAADLRQVAQRSAQLANLRGVRVYAVLAQRQSLPRDPAPLLAELPRPRHLWWRGASWLLTQGHSAHLALSGPGRATRLAAAFATLKERCCCVGDLPGGLPLATLAFAFEERAPGPGAWGGDLPGAEAILPRHAWWRQGRSGYYIVSCHVDPGDSADLVAQRLGQESTASAEAPSAADHPWHPLSPVDFQSLVREAVALVHHGALRKVVLARAVDVALARPPRMTSLVARLRERCDSDTILYWYDLPGSASFCGASPETLFAIDGQRIHSMALAGSRPRGDSPDKDRALAKELLASTKERKEHNLVLEHLARVLQDRVHSLSTPPAPRLRRLGTVQHLQSDIEADLRAPDPFDLLAQLHPTPAVCGLPTRLAADHIRRHEGLQRGLYSGVLGWLTPQRCHLMVALRGGIIAPHKARIFAGAGIVETSDPAAEERETDTKLSLMRQVLAADSAS